MNAESYLAHPLQHHGVSRRRRLAEALLPTSIPVDERLTADLLLYARTYAQLLAYTDPEGQPAGDWTSLIEGDVSVLAAMLVRQEKAAYYQHRFQTLSDTFKREAGTAVGEAALRDLLYLLREMALKLLGWQAQAAPGLGLRTQLDRLIPAIAGDGFCRLLAYLRQATALHLIPADLPLDRYDTEWPLVEPPRGFKPFPKGLPVHPDDVFKESVALRQIFRKLFEVISPVLAGAPAYLEETLSRYPRHEPHMALFLTFVQLMGIVRQDMNTITERHLEFYYREVLHLDNLPAVPDQVHIVLELAQGFVNGLLETSDRFLDGKDATNRDILFAPQAELVVTPAKLDPDHGLKTLFFTKNKRSEDDEPLQYEILNAYGSPDADSDARQAEDGKWFPLGTAQDPAARFGFAIASPMFLLGEGEREIVMRFRMEGLGEILQTYSFSRVSNELERNVHIYYSGAQKWVEITHKSVLIDQNEELLTYTLVLSADFDPVVNYHAGLIGQIPVTDALPSIYPVLAFILDNYGLSVEGDLDLSLEGDLSTQVYDPNQLYLSGSFTFPDQSYNKIFLAQGQILGIPPLVPDPDNPLVFISNLLNIWEEITASIVMPTDISLLLANLPELKAGTYVSLGGQIYRVNVTLPTFYNGIPPGPPDESRLIWPALSNVEGVFDPEVEYLPLETVEDDQALYVAGAGVSAIAPNRADTVWRLVGDGNAMSLYSLADYQFFKFGTTPYRLQALETTDMPLSTSQQMPIWKDITATIKLYFLNTANLFEESDQVFNTTNSKLYRLIGDISNTRKTDAPPGTAVGDIWKKVKPFSLTEVYNPTQIPYALGVGGVYRCNTVISNETGPGSINNQELVTPGAFVHNTAVSVWMEIPNFISGTPYAAGSFVRVPGAAGTPPTPDAFYYAKVPTSNPVTNASDWAFIGNGGSGGIGGIVSTYAATQYTFGRIVFRSNTFYAASVSVEVGSSTLFINLPLWDSVTASIPPHNSSTLYEPVDCVIYNTNDYYFASYRNESIRPDLGHVWELLGDIPLTLSSPNLPGDRVHTLQAGNYKFYECQAKTDQVLPSSGTTIWAAYSDPIEPFDPIIPYQEDVIVTWKEAYYYSLAIVTRFAPSYEVPLGSPNPANQNSWAKLTDVLDFENNHLYPIGSVVRFFDGESRYFQARVETQDIHPALGLYIWEAVSTPIGAYNGDTLYQTGAYVVFNSNGANKFYRAAVANQRVVPDQGQLIWQQDTAVSFIPYPFAGSIPPAGSYVIYQDQLFRLLVDTPTSVPGINTVEWQPVGLIRYHNPGIKWYPNMHVQDTTGNVFKAIQDIPVRIPLTDTAFWQLVSGSYPYKYLLGSGLAQLDIEVTVTGMRNLILENDQGVLNAAKPFMPFGATPAKGARFYLGSYEVFSKSVTNLELAVAWGNVPADFEDYYAKYPNAGINNETFKGAASLLDEFDWQAISLGNTFELFTEAGQPELIPDIVYTFEVSDFARTPDLAAFTSTSPVPRRGFMTLELQQSFLHEQYPTILTELALGIITPATTSSNNQTTQSNVPNPPYTPLINSLTLSYTARETLVFKDKTPGDFDGSAEQFFHLHPYGYTEFVPVDPALDDGSGAIASRELVPRYLAQAGDEEGLALVNDDLSPLLRDAAGNLLIGIAGLIAPQVITILCQVAEGSENPARDKRFVSWSYLSDNRWQYFEVSQILSDDTNGLLRPGIIKLSVPADATSANTMLPGGLVWLRASVTEDPDGIGSLYDVRLHAVKATFEDNDNDLTRLATPLVAGSLSKLFFRKAIIKKVDQPFASFGGSLEEPDTDFYVRVSERLRHKRRAVSIFDYERLVLAQYPQVYQVKCITHAESLSLSGPEGAKTWDQFIHDELKKGIEHRPGHVQVIVLPDLRNQNAIDPLRPRVNNNLRDEIETWLQSLASGFAVVKVENPVFEEVKVHAVVTLKPGKDPGFYLTQLNEDLIRYLSPWRFDTEYDLRFGACLDLSPLINYMDELDYVDYVENVRLSVIIRDDQDVAHTLVEGAEEVCTHTAASVLVSAAQHDLHLNENLNRC
ncbi:MAG: baseplate J/gp47 family protein [Bacteroidia bacterium]|nr:baseplate J/gp47 family protein [Bacteroidia bacterium]